MAVVFTLYLKEDVDEDGNVKAGVEAGKPGYGGTLEGEAEGETETETENKEIEKKEEAKTNDDDDVD